MAAIVAGSVKAVAEKAEETQSILAAWGKAVALTLLEIAAEGGRSFALIHFSDAGGGMDFSLKEFCEKVYRTSELTGDEIVRDIVVSRA